MEIKQYQLILVNLDPNIGSEMKKTRPCVVLSPGEMNRHLQTIVIAPITSTPRPYPTRVEINNAKTKGWVALDQIRTINRKRVIKTFDLLSDHESISIKNVIRETYVD